MADRTTRNLADINSKYIQEKHIATGDVYFQSQICQFNMLHFDTVLSMIYYKATN